MTEEILNVCTVLKKQNDIKSTNFVWKQGTKISASVVIFFYFFAAYMISEVLIWYFPEHVCVFLFSVWDSMKLPLLYGMCASVTVGVFSLVLGLVCAHCCFRSTSSTPRSRTKLMELEMDWQTLNPNSWTPWGQFDWHTREACWRSQKKTTEPRLRCLMNILH